MQIGEIDLTPAELKAIGDHKYFLSQRCGREVTIEEAIEDFVRHFAEDWRREKMRRDNQAQRAEIEKHKYFRSMQEKRDIGRHAAAEEWCEKYAHIWRAERESLMRNGFEKITVTVRNEHGLHMRPMSSVAMLAGRFDCDMYVHKEGMPYWNFALSGRPYMNVKSIVSLLSIEASMGDTLEFIAAGAQARQALSALVQLLAQKPAASGKE